MLKLNNFFTSNRIFSDDDWNLKSRYQMLNIGLVMSSMAIIYAIALNFSRNIHGIIPVDLIVLSINIILFWVLRIYKNSLNIVTIILTTQISLLFLWLIYTTDPYELKHVWLFTFPIIMLFFKNKNTGIYWVSFMLVMLNIAPYQTMVEVQYVQFQLIYLSVALVTVSIIIYFYQYKMEEARVLIMKQQSMQKRSNEELQKQLVELKLQDSLLSSQSRQAVMGEMIGMIAHQWRQPLSTITLQISSLKIKKELDIDISLDDVDAVLSDISDRIIYLSETIDDFQTYFNPNKEKTDIKTDILMKKLLNFNIPRLKDTEVEIELNLNEVVVLKIYENELIQVLLNILNNAVDALTSDGIKEPKITISLRATAKGSIKIEIVDNAKGIDADDIEHIFEPYFSTKGKNGTGLGLYMCQMIMQKQFSTHIEVKSSSFGTSFIVEVPLDVDDVVSTL